MDLQYRTAHQGLVNGHLGAKTQLVGHRLLSMAGDNGQVNLAWESFCALCECDNINAARRHLTRLADAGLIHYSTNEYVYVTWLAWMVDAQPAVRERAGPVAEVRVDAQPAARGRAEPVSEVRVDAQPAARGRAEGAAWESEDRRAGAQERSEVRASAPSAARGRARGGTTYVRQLVSPPDLEGGTNELTAGEAARAVALLTDSEVGLDMRKAEALAAVVSFEEIVRQVFTWRREVMVGKVSGQGALVHRIRSRFGASVTDADRRSALWRRHVGPPGDGDGRDYMPAEYRDIILG